MKNLLLFTFLLISLLFHSFSYATKPCFPLSGDKLEELKKNLVKPDIEAKFIVKEIGDDFMLVENTRLGLLRVNTTLHHPSVLNIKSGYGVRLSLKKELDSKGYILANVFWIHCITSVEDIIDLTLGYYIHDGVLTRYDNN
jgi:hypothetical protein